MIRCPGCTNTIRTLCDHEPGCLVLKLETQDTEPLTPDAARIVELERHIEKLRGAIEAMGAGRRRCEPVLAVALALGRQWAKGSSMTSDDYANLHHLNALADAVKAFDALQPEG